MKIKLDRIISIATLVASLVGHYSGVEEAGAGGAAAGSGGDLRMHAQSLDQKMEQLEPAMQQVRRPPRKQLRGANLRRATQNQSRLLPVHSRKLKSLSADGIGALLAQAAGAAGGGGLSPDSDLGSGEPNIKDQQVTYEGDMVHGKFLTEIAGKDVWVTISGHMGSKDGYATFEPTEFKVGDVSVPVSLVNPALQRKLAEQRDAETSRTNFRS